MRVYEKILMQAAWLVLCLLLLAGSRMPQVDYERKTLNIPSETLSQEIGPEEISQTAVFPCEMAGIRLRFRVSGEVPEGELVFRLYAENAPAAGPDPDMYPAGAMPAEEIEEIVVPAQALEKEEFLDILFTKPAAPGAYRMTLHADSQAQEGIRLWESAQDVYLDGCAYDADGYGESGDWDMKYLLPYPSGMLQRRRILKDMGLILSVLLFLAGSAWIWAGEKSRQAAVRFRTGRTGHRQPGSGNRACAVSLLLLAAVPTLLYLDYLLGDRLCIFNMLDRGSDSLSQTYPTLLDTARRLSSGKTGSGYNFSQGLGAAFHAFFPNLTNWVSLFGEKHVAYLMGVSQWLKVVLAGWLAWGVARENGLSPAGSLGVAFGYQMNSMLIARGAWESYPNTALMLIFWLYASFRCRRVKKYVLYALATFLFFAGSVLYDCLFYAGLLAVYLLWRHFLLLPRSERAQDDLGKQLFFLVLFAGLGMGDTVAHELAAAVHSPRMQEGVALLDGFVKEGGSQRVLVWITAFARSIGHSIMGITEQTGTGNFLEGPAFYCGIGALLSVPAALAGMDRRKRAAYIPLLALAALYLASARLRLITNGLAKDTFKLSSFWITLTVFLLWIERLKIAENFREQEAALPETASSCLVRKRSMQAVIISITAVCAAAGLIALRAGGYVRSLFAWRVSLLLVAAYLLLEWLFQTRHIREAALLFALAVSAEALLVPAETISERQTCSLFEMTCSAYADGTGDALERIRELEAGGGEGPVWHRTEKQYTSVLHADALAQDYRGTTSYVGGTGIDRNVQEIYEAYQLPVNTGRVMEGSGGNIAFCDAAGVKYYLTRENMVTRHGFEHAADAGQIHICRNENALPPAYITSVQVQELQPYDYRRDVFRIFPEKKGSNAWSFAQIIRGGVLLIDAQFAAEGEGRLCVLDESGHVSCSRFRQSENTHLELSAHDLTAMWFEGVSGADLTDLQVYCCDEAAYYKALDDWAAMCRANALTWTEAGENRFEGTVSCPGGGYMLATVFPWHENWQILVDGEKVQTRQVNGGFLGADLSGGEHRICITYRCVPWLADNLFRACGALLLILFAAAQLIRKKRTPAGEPL